MALPEATCERSGSHRTFKVRNKVFAYLLDDHHNDGRLAVCCKTELGEHADLARRYPDKFYLPANIGSKGWVAIRLDRPKVDWDEIRDFIRASYKRVGPKTMSKIA
ncbi:MAG TPA: MmcQ/YjbR family DNA-binding protein [Thermoanaerobaculia bacterium]|nr:MmcQ/YjbR family DNA-binding protein [Thermoanaerobaculia bacterium]